MFKDMSEEYDVKIKIRDPEYFDFESIKATATLHKNLVNINLKLLKNKSILIKSILHEIGHIVCFRKGIYKNYHTTNNIISNMSEEVKRLKILTGLKAEKYVDRWASNELKKWNNRLKYDFSYSNIGVQKRYKEWLKRYK
jgi:predicted SprT family Zn-dependent metalloprotease